VKKIWETTGKSGPKHLECLKTRDARKANVALVAGMAPKEQLHIGDGKARISQSTEFLKKYR
jgi:hypothetical protein